MRIIEGDRPDRCRIIGDGLPFEIDLSGMRNTELHGLLHGGTDSRQWLDRVGQPPFTANSLEADTPANPDTSPASHDLDDGHFQATSGGPGQVQIAEHHQRPVNLLPRSLHLLLAQQWARSGILSLHAAAILTPTGGILVIGPRGGGKSVLTLSALVAGHAVISDDWILLGKGEDNHIHVERLRPFMMLRQSWAADQLRARVPRLNTRALANRPKQVIHLPANSKRFPVSAPINRIWLLKRPRSARTQQTRLAPTSPTTALSKIVEASMPLLFSKQFPIEHQQLMATIQTLLKGAPAFEAETGTDIVEDPVGAWGKELGEGAKG
jgi:hypothetical protein